jgi:hypothetical protein
MKFKRPVDHAFRQVFALFAAGLGRVGALQHAIVAQSDLYALHLGTLVEGVD